MKKREPRVTAGKPVATEPYTGLLAKLAPVPLIFYFREGQPLWFALRQLKLERPRQIVAALNGTRPEVLDIETAWQEFLQRDLERWKRHQAECWELLCKHYCIPTIPNVEASDAGKLAAALAEQHVPGFQVRRAAEPRPAAKKPIKLDVEGSICCFF